MTQEIREPARGRAVLLVAFAVVAAAIVALVLWWSLGRGDDSAPSATPSTSSPATPGKTSPATTGQGSGTPTKSSPPVSFPAGPTPTKPVVGSTGPAATRTDAPVPQEEKAVAPTAKATTATGVEVRIAKVESVKGTAVAPGEIAGPALRLTIAIENGQRQSLELGLVAVNAYVGPKRVPAGTLMTPGGRPFAGDLAPGKSATAVYLFTVAPAQRSDVTVTVDYSAVARTVAFRGPLG